TTWPSRATKRFRRTSRRKSSRRRRRKRKRPRSSRARQGLTPKRSLPITVVRTVPVRGQVPLHLAQGTDPQGPVPNTATGTVPVRQQSLYSRAVSVGRKFAAIVARMRITRLSVARSCAVCERTLLMGERSTRFTPDGENFVDVCPLCQDIALEYG